MRKKAKKSCADLHQQRPTTEVHMQHSGRTQPLIIPLIHTENATCASLEYRRSRKVGKGVWKNPTMSCPRQHAQWTRQQYSGSYRAALARKCRNSTPPPHSMENLQQTSTALERLFRALDTHEKKACGAPANNSTVYWRARALFSTYAHLTIQPNPSPVCPT